MLQADIFLCHSICCLRSLICHNWGRRVPPLECAHCIPGQTKAAAYVCPTAQGTRPLKSSCRPSQDRGQHDASRSASRSTVCGLKRVKQGPVEPRSRRKMSQLELLTPTRGSPLDHPRRRAAQEPQLTDCCMGRWTRQMLAHCRVHCLAWFRTPACLEKVASSLQ